MQSNFDKTVKTRRTHNFDFEEEKRERKRLDQQRRRARQDKRAEPEEVEA